MGESSTHLQGRLPGILSAMVRALGWMLCALALLGAACGSSEAAASTPPENPQVAGLVPGMDLTSAQAIGWTPEQADTARRYSRGNWTLWFTGSIWQIAVLALLSFSGMAGRIVRAVEARVKGRLAADALSLLALILALAALSFPMEILRYARERSYGFATQGVASWLRDEFTGLAVACVLGLLVLLPIYRVIRRWPRGWWAIGSGIGLVFIVFVMAVAPVFIAPLFNTFTPLSDQALKQRILDLAHQNGIAADDVYQVDASRQSRHDNAYVAGMLGTQRIVLYDTLLAAYQPAEIEFVMGHEMGHYVLHHIWKGVTFASLLLAVGLYITYRAMRRLIATRARLLGYDAPGSPASFPLLALCLSTFFFLVAPLDNGYSRMLEHDADAFGLAATGTARAPAVQAFQRMAGRNLSDPNPPALIEWWIYSHPSMGNRIRFLAGQN